MALSLVVIDKMAAFRVFTFGVRPSFSSFLERSRSTYSELDVKHAFDCTNKKTMENANTIVSSRCFQMHVETRSTKIYGDPKILKIKAGLTSYFKAYTCITRI